MVTIKLKKCIQGWRYPKPFSFLSTPDRYIDQVYNIPFFNGLALHESEKVGRAFEKSSQDETLSQEEIGDCLKWFCLIFGNKFTIDELLKGYQVDRLMMDIFSAYYAMQQHVMEALTEFPIQPTAMEESKEA